MPQRMKFLASFGMLWAVLLLSGCGGGGDGDIGGGASTAPFPTHSEDILPTGERIDVSTKNLFALSHGNTWTYTKLNAQGFKFGDVVDYVISGPDSLGQVQLTSTDGGMTEIEKYIVSSEGVLDGSVADALPQSAAFIIGSYLMYPTLLYPVDAERLLVRSGPWGEDLDGDGIGESFRFEYSQVFVGFETVTLPGAGDISEVAHFRNVTRLTIRPTAPGNTDYTVTANEEAYFAPGVGMIKYVYDISDSDGVVLEPVTTLLLTSAIVDYASWPPIPLDGTARDVFLNHNTLVYDASRNRYYASVPGSVVTNGNRIAIIDPSNGQVTYSSHVGSEPNAIAISSDGAVLYVGLDGSREVVRLELPSMTETGRVQLIENTVFGPAYPAAETISVSPTDASVVAVSMAYPGSSPRHAGVVLLRNMVLQPKHTQTHIGSNLIAFDDSGANLYGLNIETGELGLRSIEVLADGLAEQLVVLNATEFGTQSLAYSGNKIIVRNTLYNSSNLTLAGVVPGAMACWPHSTGTQLMCFASFSGTLEGRILVADPNTFEVGTSLRFAPDIPYHARLVQGPMDQVAVSYSYNYTVSSKIRLFTSPSLP